jgi:hypothetical protein
MSILDDDNKHDAEIVRIFRYFAKWKLCPYGEWTEGDGSRVIFDRHYRPICRIKPDGQVEIVPTDESIHFDKKTGQRWFYEGSASTRDPKVRKALIGIIKRYDLTPELRRRWDIIRHGGHLSASDRHT